MAFLVVEDCTDIKSIFLTLKKLHKTIDNVLKECTISTGNKAYYDKLLLCMINGY